MRLVIKWREFKESIKSFIYEADQLLELKEEAAERLDHINTLRAIDEWVCTCHSYLKNSFDNVNNEFAQSFYLIKPYTSYINNGIKDDIQKVNTVFEELKSKRNHLEYQLRILSISDIVIEPNLVDKKIRSEYTNYEISDLILDKLYHLYDNLYYPVQAILRGNGIKFSDINKIKNLIETLVKNGFINAVYTRSIDVQLSLEGRKHVEERRRFELLDKIYFSSNRELMNVKIKELEKSINRTGLGNTQLMKELNEMKSFYNKLNKKNWSELVKGKLIDLETAKVINKEAMEKINQSTTNDGTGYV